MNDRPNRVPPAFLAIALLIVVSLACSPTGALPGGGAQPTTQATQSSSTQPTSSPNQPTPTAGASSGKGAFDKLDDLDSYRMKMTWWSKDQDPAKDKGMVTITEWVKNIRARRVVMGETVEVITIGDKTWTKVAGKWVEQQKPPAQNTGVGLSDDILRQMQEKFDFKEVGRDTVIGIPCKRYSYSGQMTLPIQQTNIKGDATIKGQGEVCIADKAGLLRVPLRDKMDAEMTVKLTGESKLPPGGMNVAMHMETEVSDINTPITIKPPEGATSGPVVPVTTPVAPRPTQAVAATPTQSSKATPVGQVPPTMVPSGPKTISLAVKGTDVIYLAGRVDVKIPPLGAEDESFPILRCNSELLETFPASIAVTPGAQLTFKVTGAMDFWGGTSPNGPDGTDVSAIESRDGLSGYTGPQGALVGVFLDAANPKDRSAPDALDMESLGTEFATLTPALGQVFFIGDGLTGTGEGNVQKLTVPRGAMRLFLGIADASGFGGQPGCYGDNLGAFQVQAAIP